MEEENNPEWLAPLDHTADAGFVVTADDLPRLFSRAAWGMFDMLCNIDAVEPRETVKVAVEVEEADLPELLRKWLSDLNYRHITEDWLFDRFDVREVSKKRVEAEVSGEKICSERHEVFTEIKAVTFHGLEVEQDDKGRWKAQVIFDL